MEIIGAAGLIALLGTVIGYLLNSNRQDRQQHRELIADLRKEMKDQKIAHDIEIKELDARVNSLQKEVETERRLRRVAEDLASTTQRQLNLVYPPPQEGTGT